MEENGIKLDKRIPLTWILALLFAVGGLYISFRVSQNDIDIIKCTTADHEKRVTVIETELRAMRDDQAEMKRDVKELLQRVR